MYGYFDDSGTDKASPIAVMAGYVAHAADWKKFENKSRRLFDKEEIPFFRAKLFEHGQKQFRGWEPERKLAFANKWLGFAHPLITRAVSSAAVKSDIYAARSMDKKIPAVSPQAYCLQIALKHLCMDNAVWEGVQRYGLHLFIESSTPGTDAGMREDFDRMVGVNKIRKHLKSVTFMPKASSRALQLADYLAYYSHRFALTSINDSFEGRTEYLDIAQGNVETIMKLAHSFKPNPEYRAALKAWKKSSD